jgi:dihydroorotate dehydrogenase
MYAAQSPESTSRLQFAAFDVLNPVLRGLFDGEQAHVAAVAAASRGWIPTEHRPDCNALRVTVWGLKFPNPIGLAAGFDKNAEAYPQLLDMGFGFVRARPHTQTHAHTESHARTRAHSRPRARAHAHTHTRTHAGRDRVGHAVAARRQPEASRV